MTACCGDNCGTCEGQIVVRYDLAEAGGGDWDVDATVEPSADCTLPGGATYQLVHVNDVCTTNTKSPWPMTFTLGVPLTLSATQIVDMDLGNVMTVISGNYTASGGGATASVYGSVQMKIDVPTVSAWGLAVLIGLVAVSATVLIRRRAVAA